MKKTNIINKYLTIENKDNNFFLMDDGDQLLLNKGNQESIFKTILYLLNIDFKSLKQLKDFQSVVNLINLSNNYNAVLLNSNDKQFIKIFKGVWKWKINIER